MGHPIKWQEELVGIAWINIALIVVSLPLFSIYIVESLQSDGGSAENFMLHTDRGQQFVEVIVKYLVAVLFWVPISILMKIGATKPSFTLIKACSAAKLVFIFVLALQMIVEPPASILVVCSYAVCFVYLLASLWISKNFLEELKGDKGDTTPVIDNLSNEIIECDNYDELNDVADQRFVFRMQPLGNKSSASGRSKF